jgi:hypothetical protein
MKRVANKPSYTTTTTGSSQFSFDVTETSTSNQSSCDQREHQLSRMKDVMCAQKQEFELQVGELHHLLDRQRDIVKARADIVPQVVEAYASISKDEGRQE